MKRICHALLTEDEAVLLEALRPSAGDRIFALFAYGNGDAALALLAERPTSIVVYDLFDQPGLESQLRLKNELYRKLDVAAFRRFLGIEAGIRNRERIAITDDVMASLPANARSFWRSRRKSLARGLANSDATGRWVTRLRWFVRWQAQLPSALRRLILRTAVQLAPLYFPQEERRHSLGFRQMMNFPERALDRLVSPSPRSDVDPLLGFDRFRYISSPAYDRIRQIVDRIEIQCSTIPTAGPEFDRPFNKIYLSNVIDYLPQEGFQRLFSRLLVSQQSSSWTAFLNSTYDSHDYHPYLRNGLDAGCFEIDVDRTTALRKLDRFGVYPGLTVLQGRGP